MSALFLGFIAGLDGTGISCSLVRSAQHTALDYRDRRGNARAQSLRSWTPSLSLTNLQDDRNARWMSLAVIGVRRTPARPLAIDFVMYSHCHSAEGISRFWICCTSLWRSSTGRRRSPTFPAAFCLRYPTPPAPYPRHGPSAAAHRSTQNN